jgi:hypothetical protein
MKKLVISIAVIAVVAVALGTAGLVYAQASTPPAPGTGYGYGMMNGQGMRGGMGAGMGIRNGVGQTAAGTQSGFMHDEMIAAFADKLGISVDDLNAQLASGKTMSQIASEKGLTADQFRTLMLDARSQALDQAVKDGTLTQAQADWMKTRGQGMMGAGRGMRGTGQGQFANPNCPYYTPAQ